LLVTFSVTRDVSAASKNAPAITVKPTQMVARGSITCGYVKTGKQKKLTWQAGTRVSAKKFRPYASEISFLNQLLATQNKTLKKAKSQNKRRQVVSLTKELAETRLRLSRLRSQSSSEKSECAQLTSLRYDTKDVIALAVVAPSSDRGSVSKKSASSANVNTKSGLVGITSNGKAKTIIQPIDARVQGLSENLSVVRTYGAPDGSVITQYAEHPDKCLLGKISPLGGLEECQLFREQLGLYEGIRSGSSGYFGNEASPIQFDESGGIYFVSGKRDYTCSPQAPSAVIYSYSLFVLSDGKVAGYPLTACATLTTWSVMSTGGVLYNIRPLGAWTWPDVKVMKWDGTTESTLLEGADVTPNGMQSFPNGDTLISLRDYVLLGPPSSYGSVQGATYRYRSIEGLDAWWHYADQNPQFSSESVADQHCNCDAQLPLITNLIRIDSDLYGTGDIFNTQTGGRTHHIFQLYPQVEVIARTGKIWNRPVAVGTRETLQVSGILAKTKSWFLTAGPNYFWCLPQQIANNGIPCVAEQHFIHAINVTTNQVMELQDSTNPVGVLSISSSVTDDVSYIQGIRISDGRHMIGTFSGSSGAPTISWIENQSLNFKYVPFTFIRKKSANG
jgi:hypothetical protein